MGAVLIVFPPIVSDDHASLGEGVQLFSVQAFVPEASMKTFHEAVLPGTSRFDVEDLHPVFLQSLLYQGSASGRFGEIRPLGVRLADAHTRSKF